MNLDNMDEQSKPLTIDIDDVTLPSDQAPDLADQAEPELASDDIDTRKDGSATDKIKEFVFTTVPNGAATCAQWAGKNPGKAAGIAASTVILAAPGLVVGPALAVAGFGAEGVVAGSMAAGAQAAAGNVAAGSAFAVLQSAGAAGYGLGIVNGAVQAAAGVGAAAAGVAAAARRKTGKASA